MGKLEVCRKQNSTLDWQPLQEAAPGSQPGQGPAPATSTPTAVSAATIAPYLIGDQYPKYTKTHTTQHQRCKQPDLKMGILNRHFP